MSEIETTSTSALPVPSLNSGKNIDLLEMYAEEEAAKQSEVAEEVEKQAAVAAELPKKLIANKLAKKLTDKQLKEHNETRSEELSETEGQGQEEEKVEVPDVPIRSFKAKHGETEIEVPEEAVISQEINGRPLQVKVKDALKSYIGQEKWNRELDRRINYVTNREKTVDTTVNTIRTKFKEMAELSSQGDHLGALKVLAEVSGKDPVEYEKSFLQTLDKVNQVYAGMTPEQRDAYFANRKAENLAKKNKELEDKHKEIQTQSEVHRKVLTLCEENGMSEKDFADSFSSLTELGYDPKTLSAEQVVVHYQDVNHARKVGSAIGLVDPNLAEDEFLVGELIKDTRNNPELTEEDIAKIVRDVVGVDSQSVQNLNRKVEKANKNGLRAQATQGSSNGKKVQKEEDSYLSFFEEEFGKRPVVTRRY